MRDAQCQISVKFRLQELLDYVMIKNMYKYV